jgi:hypothetical protein
LILNQRMSALWLLELEEVQSLSCSFSLEDESEDDDDDELENAARRFRFLVRFLFV